MKTVKKSVKAVAVILLLTLGLIYNHSNYFNVFGNKLNDKVLSEIQSETQKKSEKSFFTYTTDILKAGFYTIF